FVDPALDGFTKTLIFSSWQVVPKAIAALVSYAAERRIMIDHEDAPENSSEAREKKSPLVRFTAAAGVTAFTLVYPSFALAEAGEAAIRDGSTGGRVSDVGALVESIKSRLSPALASMGQLYARAAGEDEQWYAIAPILLDAETDREATVSWLAADGLAARWTGEDGKGAAEGEGPAGLSQIHIPRFQQFAAGKGTELGQQPGDLADVLAIMALAAPAIAALRAFGSVIDGSSLRDCDIRESAARVGYGFRNLFNLLE